MANLKVIKVKKKLYKQFCQATYPAQRVNLHQKIKKCRNQIITANCLCKENYFKRFWNQKRINPKNIWYGIKILTSTKISKKGSQRLTLNINNKTILDEHIVANHFNSFFTSIAGKLLKKTSETRETSNSFLTKSIFISYHARWSRKYIKNLLSK